MSRIIATNNGYGSHFPRIWGPVKEFVNYAVVSSPAWSLDIGCSWGSHSLAAIQAGARVIAVDLDARHLGHLAQQVPLHLRRDLQTRCGDFQRIALPKRSIGAILAANVFRFLDDGALERTIGKMFHLLRPQGKVFVVTQPPMHAPSLSWSDMFYQIKMPKNADQFLDTKRSSSLFEAAGFVIERAGYRRGNFDQQLTTLVARKP